MEERILELLKKLVGHRDQVLSFYLTALDNYVPKEGSMEAVGRAGMLHDLDKHITNLEMELKRIEAHALQRMETINV